MPESVEKNWRQTLFLLESDLCWQTTAPVVALHVYLAEGTADDTSAKAEMFKCQIDWIKKGIVFYYVPTSDVLHAKHHTKKKPTRKIFYLPQFFLSL